MSKANAIPILKETDGAVRLTISSDHPNIEEEEDEAEDPPEAESSMVQAVTAVITESAPINYRTTDLDDPSSSDEEITPDMQRIGKAILKQRVTIWCS